MAWNSTYQSRAGQFSLSIGTDKNMYDYTFKASLSFSQERNLTDTLNKFSLDVVDDGSKDFTSLEAVLLSGLTVIKFTYGTGTENMLSWSGFIYDFTSTFFGDKIKLTIVGYVTLVTGTKSDYAGHYYRLDWSPMIPYRRDFTKDWNRFQSSEYIWERDSSEAEIPEISEEKFLQSYEDAYNKAVKSDARDMNNGGVGTDFKWYNILGYLGGLGDGFKSAEDWEVLIRKYLEEGDNPSAYAWVYDVKYFMDEWGIQSTRAYEALKSARERYQLYQTLYNSYFSQYNAGSFSTELKVDTLENSVFSRFPNVGGDFTSENQIYIPVPDLFIQWDGILPDVVWKDNKYDINYSTLLGNLCDVVAFGLLVETVGSTTNKDEPPTVQLKMSGSRKYNDTYGNLRVLKMNNATFICVSDAKSFAEARWGKFDAGGDFTEAVSSASTGSSTSKVNLNENAKKIMNYFKSRGWSDAAIAAVLGNGELESGLVPNRLQNVFNRTYTYEEAYSLYPEDEQTAHAWGIWQWDPLMKIHPTVGRSWATRVSGDRNLIETQCAILESQLDTIGWTAKHYDLSVADFKTCTDVQKTSRAFLMNFEICNGSDTEEKQQQRASKCSSYLNAIQGFNASDTKISYADGTVIPKTWYRSYYNYCLSAYRSALPLQYGGVYISDIVQKLCKIEGWKTDITPTTWSSYESISNELVMDGRNALDYIVNVLAPLASSKNGYIGYTARLDSNRTLHFKPAIPDKYNTVIMKMGYNIPDSPLLSFSCKTRGILLMKGIDADISSVTTYSNESAVLATYTKAESYIESKFAGKSKTQGSNWFSKGLFSYYGFTNSLSGYDSFFSTMYNDTFSYGRNDNNGNTSFLSSLLNGGLLNWLTNSAKSAYSGSSTSSVVNASLSNNLVRSTAYSSIAGIDSASGKLLTDLTEFEKSVIQAEINIIGDNRLVPGSYIEVINMTNRGRHYTSGVYYIMGITDNFSNGSYTQKLNCYRWSNNNSYWSGEQTAQIDKVDQATSELISNIIKPGVDEKQADKLIEDFLKRTKS